MPVPQAIVSGRAFGGDLYLIGMMAHLSSLVFGMFAALAPATVLAEPKAVVELFTSQGCASCTPADQYLAQLAARDDVIALSLHVDYWDYLGWQDTFGLSDNSERQRVYAAVAGSRRLVTPQVVVNGAVHLDPNDRAAIDAAIENADLPVPVRLRRDNGKVKIEVGEYLRPAPWQTTIRLVLFSQRATVKIEAGENAHATRTYRNVVRAIRPIGMWDGNAVKISLPEDEILADGVDGFAILVQEDLPEGPGAIIGAAKLEKL